MKLSAAIDLYIAKRQAMGEKFYSPATVLRALSRSHGEIELSSLTPDQMSSFLSGPRTGPATWRHKYGTLRVFFEHWRVREELRVAPLPPPAPKYTTSFVPYIYSVLRVAAVAGRRSLLPAKRGVPYVGIHVPCSAASALRHWDADRGSAAAAWCAMPILSMASSPCGERSSISRGWFLSEPMFMNICGRILRQLEEWIATMNRSSNPAYTSRFHVRWLKRASGSCATWRAFAGKRAAPISHASMICDIPSRFIG